MELESYISRLQNISTNLEKEVELALKEKSGSILGLLKARLFNKGTDGNNIPLAPYSKKTIAIKRVNGQKVNITTLRDQGNFYDGMYLEVRGSEILISSKDLKTPMIVEKYGESIFDLDEDQMQYVASEIVDKHIQKKLDELGDLEITI